MTHLRKRKSIKRKYMSQVTDWETLLIYIVSWLIRRAINITTDVIILKFAHFFYRKLCSLLAKINPEYIASPFSKVGCFSITSLVKEDLLRIYHFQYLYLMERDALKPLREYVLVEGIKIHGGTILPPDPFPSRYMYVPHRTPRENVTSLFCNLA